MAIVKREICEDTWALEDEGVRFFLLKGTESSVLIDTGMHWTCIDDILGDLKDTCMGVINTHADRDHTSGNDCFKDIYMSAAEFAHYYHSGKHTHRVHALFEGDVIDLGGRELEVISVPGHTPGSIMILDQKTHILFSGDPVQEGNGIFMFGENRNMYAYTEGLRHLLEWEDEIDEIWPCHGKAPLRTDLVYDLIEEAEQVIAGEIPGKKETKFDKEITVYRTAHAVFLCD